MNELADAQIFGAQPWHYEDFDHQSRIGQDIFGEDWPFLQKLATVKLFHGKPVRISVRVRRGHPEMTQYPIMSSFTGAYDVVMMHPQDFAWFMIGTKHWEIAHALSMKALMWLIDRSVDRALARIDRPTKTEWDQYMEDTYGEYDDEEEEYERE